MKRKGLILLCFFALSIQAQNLRDVVAVVRPNYTENAVKFLTDFSSSLQKRGYTDAAELLAAYSKGGYGTGILWKNPKENRYYIITNRHVIAQARDVNIEFMRANEAVTKYEKCQIVAVDEGTEMALIALPDNADFAISLTLSAAEIADGKEVYTAGFPGLGGDPSWQLGKGIISNNSVKMKDWTIQKGANIIQHTAQVDPGSSGGPLLIADNSPVGYSIIGINTWQAKRRENANFSVSAATMQRFLNKHFAEKNSQSKASLQDRAQKFVQSVKEGYRSVYPHISDDYIRNISVDNFYELFNSLTDSVRTEVGECFGNGMPIDGVRIGLAEALSNRFKKKTLSFSQVSDFSDSTAKVAFQYGKDPIDSDWTFRNGEWGMANFTALSMRDMAKSGVATTFGYKNAVLLGFGFPANDMTKMHYAITYEYTLATFGVLGFDLSSGKLQLPYTTWSENGKEEVEKEATYKHTYLGMHAGLQFPIKTGSIYIIPNAKIYYGIEVMKNVSQEDDWGDDGTLGSWAYSFGLNVAYKLKRKTYLIGGLQYKTTSFSGDDYSKSKPSIVELMVGISF